MAKTTVEQLIRRAKNAHLISSDEEVQAAIEFVAEILDAQIQHTEETEPYATRSIAEMRKAYSIVRDLDEFLEGVK